MSDSRPGLGRTLLWIAVGVVIGWLLHENRELAGRLASGDVDTPTGVSAARSPNAFFEIELLSDAAGGRAQRTLCLLDGRHGLVIQDDEVRNRDSHVDFDWYHSGAFTAGIQGGEEGLVHDLGTVQELEARLGGPPLEVLRWVDGELRAQGEPVDAPTDLPPGSRGAPAPSWIESLFSLGPASATTSNHAAVYLDHVYFVRIVNSSDGDEIVGLLQVLDLELGRRVQLRCARL